VPGNYAVNVGTVTALVGGEPWTSTDLEVTLVVDSDTLEVIQLGVIARRPDGTGGTLDRIDFTFDNGDYTGPDTYSFTTAPPYILGMNYVPPGPGFTYQALDGTVTVSEFSFVPTLADPDIAAGRLVGTFSFNGCTTWNVSGICGGSDSSIAVTSGTFEVCNFNLIRY